MQQLHLEQQQQQQQQQQLYLQQQLQRDSAGYAPIISQLQTELESEREKVRALSAMEHAKMLQAQLEAEQAKSKHLHDRLLDNIPATAPEAGGLPAPRSSSFPNNEQANESSPPPTNVLDTFDQKLDGVIRATLDDTVDTVPRHRHDLRQRLHSIGWVEETAEQRAAGERSHSVAIHVQRSQQASLQELCLSHRQRLLRFSENPFDSCKRKGSCPFSKLVSANEPGACMCFAALLYHLTPFPMKLAVELGDKYCNAPPRQFEFSRIVT
jgi:hypothetical protein